MNKLLENLVREDLFQPYTMKESFEQILKKCTKNPDGSYSCNGTVNLSNLHLKELPVKFKRIKGNFNCSSNELVTLKGCPEYVGSKFYCSYNAVHYLESMKTVDRDYLRR